MVDVIDLNSDLGEGFGRYTLGHDARLFEVVSSANIACGFHAGDPRTMQASVHLAHENGVGIGAHPGFPDLAGFGRRELRVSHDEIVTDMIYQIGALAGFCQAAGVRLQHIKPHGALYNMAVREPAVAHAIADAVARFDPTALLFVLPNSVFEIAAHERNLRVVREIFADRAVEVDGSLVARSKPGAVITDVQEVIARTIRMVRLGVVTAITGEDISMSGETICVHGDTPDAVELLQRLRSALEDDGVRVQPVGSWLTA